MRSLEKEVYEAQKCTPIKEKNFLELPQEIQQELIESLGAVLDWLRENNFNEQVIKLSSTNIEDIFIFAEYFRFGGMRGAIDHPLANTDVWRNPPKILSSTNTLEKTAPEMRQQAFRHDLLHWVFLKSNVLRKSSRNIIVQAQGKLMHQSLSHFNKNPEYFMRFSEGCVDICAIWCGGSEQYGDRYQIYRSLVRGIAKGIWSAYKTKSEIKYLFTKLYPATIIQNSNDVLKLLVSDALNSEYTFLKLVEKVYGTGSVRKLSQIGDLYGKYGSFETFLFFIGKPDNDPDLVGEWQKANTHLEYEDYVASMKVEEGVIDRMSVGRFRELSRIKLEKIKDLETLKIECQKRTDILKKRFGLGDNSSKFLETSFFDYEKELREIFGGIENFNFAFDGYLHYDNEGNDIKPLITEEMLNKALLAREKMLKELSETGLSPETVKYDPYVFEMINATLRRIMISKFTVKYFKMIENHITELENRTLFGTDLEVEMLEELESSVSIWGTEYGNAERENRYSDFDSIGLISRINALTEKSKALKKK